MAALTDNEAALLHYLEQRPGVAISRKELLREVWGYAAKVKTRTVDVTIQRLRAKLEPDPATPRLILTVRGKGYTYKKHVPTQTTPTGLPGRSEEVEQLCQWIEAGHTRITIHGTVGTGKSTLLAHVASLHGRSVVSANALETEELAFVDLQDLPTSSWREFLDARPGRLVIAARQPLGVRAERVLLLGELPRDAWDGAAAWLEQRLGGAARSDLEPTGGLPFLIALAGTLLPEEPTTCILDPEIEGPTWMLERHRGVRAATASVVATSPPLAELIAWLQTLPFPGPDALLTRGEKRLLARFGLPTDGWLPQFLRTTGALAPKAIDRLRAWGKAPYEADIPKTLAPHADLLYTAACAPGPFAQRRDLALMAALCGGYARADQSLALLDRLLEEQPDDRELELRRVITLISGVLPGAQEAALAYTAALGRPPSSPAELHIALAGLVHAGRYDEMIRLMDASGAVKHGLPCTDRAGVVWNYYGVALLRSGDVENALAAVARGRANSTDTGRDACTFAFAIWNVRLGNLDLSKRLFEELEQHAITDAQRCGSRSQRANIALLLGDHDDALRLAEEAVQMPVASRYLRANLALARVLLVRGLTIRAMDVLQGLEGSAPLGANWAESITLWRAVCWTRLELPNNAAEVAAGLGPTTRGWFEAWRDGEALPDPKPFCDSLLAVDVQVLALL